MVCTSDACGLHVTFDWTLQGADFEVAVDSPSTLIGHVFRSVEMEFGRFIVERLVVVSEAISIAVDSKDVMSPDMPKPSRGCAVARHQPTMHT